MFGTFCICYVSKRYKQTKIQKHKFVRINYLSDTTESKLIITDILFEKGSNVLQKKTQNNTSVPHNILAKPDTIEINPIQHVKCDKVKRDNSYFTVKKSKHFFFIYLSVIIY